MSHPYDGLTPDQVVQCVETAGYRCDLRLIALNSYENRVYQVGLEDAEPVVVKFYRAERWSDAQILEEHAFTEELADHGLSVVPPTRQNDATLHHAQGFRFSVFPRRGGHAPELDNLDHLLVLGRTLGRIHRVGGAKTFQHRINMTTDTALREGAEFLLREFVPSDLRPAYESLVDHCINAVIDALGNYGAADQQRIHGDCHTGNILWREDIAHFVDLDDCLSGPVIQDLWMFLSGDRQQRELQLAELIEGYSEFNDFHPKQVAWIEPLRTRRIMLHALWLARRWDDPAFPRAFPWFQQGRFWSDHILELREQLSAMQEAPLRLL